MQSIILGKLQDCCKEKLRPQDVNDLLDTAGAHLESMAPAFESGSDNDKDAIGEFKEAFAKFKKKIAYQKGAPEGSEEQKSFKKWEAMQFFIQSLRGYCNNAGKLICGDPPNWILLIQQVAKGKLTLAEAMEIQMEAFVAVMPNMTADFQKSRKLMAEAFGEEASGDWGQSLPVQIPRQFMVAILAALQPLTAAAALSPTLLAVGLGKVANAEDIGLTEKEKTRLERAKAHVGETASSIANCARLVSYEVDPGRAISADNKAMLSLVESQDCDPARLTAAISDEYKKANKNDADEKAEKKVEHLPSRRARRLFAKAITVASPTAVKALISKTGATENSLKGLDEKLEEVQILKKKPGTNPIYSLEWDLLTSVF